MEFLTNLFYSGNILFLFTVLALVVIPAVIFVAVKFGKLHYWIENILIGKDNLKF